MSKAGIHLFSIPFDFKVVDGEIQHPNPVTPKTRSEVQQLSICVVAFLNSLEAFAIPFVAGVADDELGSQETATSFCYAVRTVIPALVLMREQDVRFESCVKLYECWDSRSQVEKLRKQKTDLENKIKATPNKRFEPAD